MQEKDKDNQSQASFAVPQIDGTEAKEHHFRDSGLLGGYSDGGFSGILAGAILGLMVWIGLGICSAWYLGWIGNRDPQQVSSEDLAVAEISSEQENNISSELGSENLPTTVAVPVQANVSNLATDLVTSNSAASNSAASTSAAKNEPESSAQLDVMPQESKPAVVPAELDPPRTSADNSSTTAQAAVEPAPFSLANQMMDLRDQNITDDKNDFDFLGTMLDPTVVKSRSPGTQNRPGENRLDAKKLGEKQSLAQQNRSPEKKDLFFGRDGDKDLSDSNSKTSNPSDLQSMPPAPETQNLKAIGSRFVDPLDSGEESGSFIDDVINARSPQSIERSDVDSNPNQPSSENPAHNNNIPPSNTAANLPADAEIRKAQLVDQQRELVLRFLRARF